LLNNIDNIFFEIYGVSFPNNNNNNCVVGRNICFGFVICDFEQVINV